MTRQQGHPLTLRALQDERHCPWGLRRWYCSRYTGYHGFKGVTGSSQMGNNPIFTLAPNFALLISPFIACQFVQKASVWPLQTKLQPNTSGPSSLSSVLGALIGALHRAKPKPSLVGPGPRPGQHRSPAPLPARPWAPLPYLAQATKPHQKLPPPAHKGSPVLIAWAGGSPSRPSPSAIKKTHLHLKKKKTQQKKHI